MSMFGFLESTYLASLVLRLATGGLMIPPGWPKLKKSKRKTSWVASRWWGWAKSFACTFTGLEFLGGLALVAGLLTRVAAVLFVHERTATTIFAQEKLKKKRMGGWELDLVYLVGALALVLLAAGAWSTDAFLGL